MDDLHAAMMALYAVEHLAPCADHATLSVKVGRQSTAQISNPGGYGSSVTADTVGMSAGECVDALTAKAREFASARVTMLQRAIDAADAMMGKVSL
jgi:hypothetical protein